MTVSLRLEYLLQWALEQSSDLEGERKAWIVATALECIDGLAGDSESFRDVSL
jgi:hypothetical protein